LVFLPTQDIITIVFKNISIMTEIDYASANYEDIVDGSPSCPVETILKSTKIDDGSESSSTVDSNSTVNSNQALKKRKINQDTDKKDRKKRFKWTDKMHKAFASAIFDIGLTTSTLHKLSDVGKLNGHNCSPEAIGKFLKHFSEFRAQTKQAAKSASSTKSKVKKTSKASNISTVIIKPFSAVVTIAPKLAIIPAPKLSIEVLKTNEIAHPHFQFNTFPRLKEGSVDAVYMSNKMETNSLTSGEEVEDSQPTSTPHHDGMMSFSPLSLDLGCGDFVWDDMDYTNLWRDDYDGGALFDPSVLNVFLEL
jgi:hypothetical protein